MYESYNDKMENILPLIESESVDVILTDPPYLYLKNQKLDKQFDEELFFREAKRVLKENGFIVLFGRGTSFYRWNTMLADMGFTFKEEIVWDKSYNTSPLMALSRVHETVSIFTKGKGTINKVKIPYLEMKGHDISSICQDIKRMRSVFNNTKSLDAVLAFLESNQIDYQIDRMDGLAASYHTDSFKNSDRSAAVMSCITQGMNEKSIIRSDYVETMREGDGIVRRNAPTGDRACNAMQSITIGLNEKSIIREGREHYKAIHPTQKPVRLLERLLSLVLPKDVERPVVLDPFAGSFSTGVAAINMGCYPILIELDKEYYDKGVERIKKDIQQLQLF